MMVAEELSAETIERLSTLELHGRPVLSAYLDLDPSRFPTPRTRDTELGSLLSEAQHDAASQDLESMQADVDGIQRMLKSERALTGGARALAIFSCSDAGILDAVRLPQPVEPIAVVDTVPWLVPLIEMVARGSWGVAVLSSRSARLLRGGPHALSQFASFSDEVHRRHSQGGWSQARFQRGIEQEVDWHVSGVGQRLLRAHRRQRFEHLVIVASAELQPTIDRLLPTALRNVVAGTVVADLEHASVEEISVAIAPVIDDVETARERALVTEVERGLGTGGASAAGVDEVLAMLEQQRVKELLVPERSTLRAGLCPQCGRLSDVDDLRCRIDGAALTTVNAVEHAARLAAQQSVDVTVIRYETDWLDQHGQFAARLRY